MAQRITRSVIARLRLASQGLLGSTCRTPDQAVRWMAAMQGQDFAGALHSVAVRVPGATMKDVRDALDAGTIVRSWPLRGTLHLTAPEDVGWIMALTAERILKGHTTRNLQLGITADDVEKVRGIALEMLDDGRSASREELQRAFESSGQATAGQRGIHLLWLLSLTGTLVQGPTVGAKQHFVRTDRWITNPRRPDREAALAELALRYFRSHGPATLKDFTWWSKLTLTDARAGLDAVKDRLVELAVDEQDSRRSTTTGMGGYWLSPETAALLDGGVPGARSLLLLPGFDEYLLGYTDRTPALDPHHKDLVVPGGNGMFKSTIVAGGRVVGTWRKATKANGAIIEPLPFRELTRDQERGLGKAAAGYARFLAN